jgi:hypothetical protein
MRQNMGTICNHRSYYNNTVHRYTTYDKPWEQSVTTRACSYAQCCYNSSCGYWLFPWFVACCVAMHSVVIIAPVVTDCSTASLHNIRQNMGTISNHKSCYSNTVHHYTTYYKTWEQSVTTGAVITTLCIATQHTTKHMHSVVITAAVVTDCSHVLSYVV